MVNFIDTLLITIILFIVWVIFSGLLMLHIRLEAKKKWSKNESKYPYFNYPFYKKIFLLGLRGSLNIAVVVFTFILNISIVIMLGVCIWNLITPNIIASYALRVVVGVYGISFLFKLIFYVAFPLRF